VAWQERMNTGLQGGQPLYPLWLAGLP